MNKKFFIFILAASLFIFLSALLIPKSKESPGQEFAATTQPETENVLLIINYGEGNVSSYSLNFESETTAFSLLENIAEKENVPLEIKQYDFGVFVKSINNLESTADVAWIYFINDESGQVAADKQKVYPGDTVEWKYIPPSY